MTADVAVPVQLVPPAPSATPGILPVLSPSASAVTAPLQLPFRASGWAAAVTSSSTRLTSQERVSPTYHWYPLSSTAMANSR